MKQPNFRKHFGTFGICVAALTAMLQPDTVKAQGMHFSQFYNAPMLVSPANTGLSSDNDYRIGANYRNQWQSVPVPFNTSSLYGDLQVFRRKFGSNWLGVGGALFTDKAGNGNLALTRLEGTLAYHIEMGETSMISVGASVASVTRSVDFNKLTFDEQWDGFVFNSTLANGEQGYHSSAKYTDIGAGINFAIFPSDLVYIKVGGALAHLNQPTESFYSQDNKVGMRGTGYVDMLARIGHSVIFNPAVYYTTEKGANEIIYGTLFSVFTGGEEANGSILLGAYNRWSEAIIGTIGYEWNGLRAMVSYDYTISTLGKYNNHNGAIEFGLRFQGKYPDKHGDNYRRVYTCPRF
ncbi:MAG: PorP/SprF family type IX secretion system membrane protein [Bacteroidetes bacterium]|nr:PorP/SprF family type IX secretion system membrane protein [Bacteroidota bacterium]